MYETQMSNPCLSLHPICCS